MISHDSRPPKEKFIAVTVGKEHACGLTAEGGVMCWGMNAWGQLGNGGSAADDIARGPAFVIGLSSGVTAVTAGGGHSCALMENGAVKCWGNNSLGQLGNGGEEDSYVPVDVEGLAGGVTAVSAGYAHTCISLESSGVKCWGSGSYGQLGNGLTKDSRVPVEVQGIPGEVSAIDAGFAHTCAVTGEGVKCWGYNDTGQLGNGSKTNRYTPAAVSGLSAEIRSISAGAGHTCAVNTDGTSFCWGANSRGQLGNGKTVDQSIPVKVQDAWMNIASISAGGSHTCAVTSEGTALCWGENKFDQLGVVKFEYKPVDVAGLTKEAVAVAAGGSHTCALLSTGGVMCWGGNRVGQLGDGTEDYYSDTPRNVVGLAGAAAIAAGDDHTCALTKTGGMKCWGEGGILGDGSYRSSIKPVNVIGLGSGVAAMALGDSHTCALTAGGGVKCWGDNYYGQVGDGTTEDRYAPVDVIGLDGGVAAIAAKGDHTCALMSGGGVKCWGDNSSGELGDGSNDDRSTPVDVVGLDGGIIAIAAGGAQTCAVTESGGLKCWGIHHDMTLHANWSEIPVDMKNLADGVRAVTAGRNHICVLMEDGGVKCWGSNWIGQLGDGSLIELRKGYSVKPILVRGLTGFD